ncbi:pyridine nucleotide-disulfide oxidoreductase [Streptomyces sulfonofaciens]|uniref:Pyridine nucleotide-disulfide oxidoreductase n=1 Tax=Streptomyces sulfonofaciens TaxID=68272 RepID=A0A919GI70_9ACTN|nr:FAD-dependent oxidoreductase [Streptomyces sulfonofaciens]GHH85250.1 pyridine nucleotide-disulfide oxidoreductase [Streptomyces sulfonofaciens]
MSDDRVVIVGASVSGLTVAETAREEGHTGEIVLVGDETRIPYDRPPLSKQLLSGEWEAERLTLRDQAALDGLGLDLRLGTRARSADAEARTVTLDDGSVLDYGTLVIATGVVPNRLPDGHGLRGVHVLHDIEDALRLREALRSAQRLVVVGAGFLGAEVAAVARKLGLTVTLVDPLPQPLVGALGETVGAMLADVHREHGVDVRCGVAVRALVGDGGAVCGVALDDGTQVPADTVLVAVGSRPAVQWLEGSGVPLGRRGADGCDGVLCDGRGMALPGVYAVGDVAAWWDARAGRRHRVEHRLTAAEQARIVGRGLVRPTAQVEPPVPFFWSDQYDLKLQVFGLPAPSHDFHLLSGSLAERRFVAAYAADGVVQAVVGCNMARQLRSWRPAVASATPVGEVLRTAVSA